MIVTIYPNFYTMTPHYRPIDQVLMRIKSGKSAELVDKAKLALDLGPKEYASAKKKLPCILFSGQFVHRCIDGLINHSGYICLDFDKFSDYESLLTWRDSLIDDRYTYSVFVSPSGNGLKCVVKIPPTDYKGHKACFMALKAYYGSEYFDDTVFDVSRICFESYDPGLQIKPDSELWTGQLFDPEPVKVEYNKATLSEQETARRLIVWSNKKFPIVSGYRNANLFRLCCSFNDFGIPRDYALSLVSEFQADDFKLAEIVTTLNSAYKKTSKHGVLRF
jgi:hypothetical protein